MSLSDASIKRPIAMSCLIIGLVLLGLNAWRKMGLELMPKMDAPFITIVTVYPGASPEEIETDIAKRIEDAVVTIGGLKHVSSSCMENVCQTLLESFKQPFLILVTLPLALIGMLWALALTAKSMEIFVLMAGVMLIGIVVNNAILIIDQFNVHIKEGAPRHKAMVMAACERFRPIIMVTLAAVLGMLPLAMGQGIGAEMRNGIGIASAGGILISGILTLVVIPVLYDLFTRKNHK